MATTKPRITITLNDKSYAVLKAISECSGQPMSTFVTEMLDSARPTLERMAVTFQKIKRAQDAERARFLESVDDAQSALEPVVMETLGQFDLFMGKIDRAIEGRGAKANAADAEARSDDAAAFAPLPSASVPSPPTNRGDTPTRANSSKPKQGKASGAVLKNAVSKKKKG